MAGQGFAHPVLHRPRHCGDRFQIDAGVKATLMQQIHQIFRADIARRTGCKWAAAQAANGGLVFHHAQLQACHHIGQANAAGVVKVQGDEHIGELLLNGFDRAPHHGWCGHAGGVAQGNMPNARCVVGRDHVQHALRGDLALKRTSKSGGHRTAHRDVELACNGGEFVHIGQCSCTGLVQVRLAMGFRGGDKAGHHVHLGGSSALRASRIGHQAGQAHTGLALHLCHHLHGIGHLGHGPGRDK